MIDRWVCEREECEVRQCGWCPSLRLCGVWNGGGVCRCRSGGVVWSVPCVAWCVAVSTAVMSCYCLVAVFCGAVQVSVSVCCSCGGVSSDRPPPHPSGGGCRRWVVVAWCGRGGGVAGIPSACRCPPRSVLASPLVCLVSPLVCLASPPVCIGVPSCLLGVPRRMAGGLEGARRPLSCVASPVLFVVLPVLVLFDSFFALCVVLCS